MSSLCWPVWLSATPSSLPRRAPFWWPACWALICQTLVIITHDENIALQAHRVIAIEDGRITRDERIREVLE